MVPEYRLYHGNSLEIAPTLQGIDAVVTDPPYGINWNTSYNFSGGKCKGNTFKPIQGDNQPFDPSPWLAYPKVVLFGYQYFSSALPIGTTFVWYKRRPNKTNKFLSDCELAWMKGGQGVYLFHHVWDGFDRETERGKTLHPTQKPVALMQWIIQRLNLPPGATILDPYCGSGSTGVAALTLGYHFIGIDCESDYVNVSKQRLSQTATELASRLPFEEVV